MPEQKLTPTSRKILELLSGKLAQDRDGLYWKWIAEQLWPDKRPGRMTLPMMKLLHGLEKKQLVTVSRDLSRWRITDAGKKALVQP